jgi:hypothetical protein
LQPYIRGPERRKRPTCSEQSSFPHPPKDADEPFKKIENETKQLSEFSRKLGENLVVLTSDEGRTEVKSNETGSLLSFKVSDDEAKDTAAWNMQSKTSSGLNGSVRPSSLVRTTRGCNG